MVVGGKERPKANEAGLCGEQCRFFRFSFNIPTAKRGCPRYVLRRGKKNIKHLHKLALLKTVLRRCEGF